MLQPDKQDAVETSPDDRHEQQESPTTDHPQKEGPIVPDQHESLELGISGVEDSVKSSLDDSDDYSDFEDAESDQFEEMPINRNPMVRMSIDLEAGPSGGFLRDRFYSFKSNRSEDSRRSSVSILARKGHDKLKQIYQEHHGKNKKEASLLRYRGTRSKTGYYITDKFYKLQCVHFIPKSDTKITTCKCGMKLDRHVLVDDFNKDDAINPKKVWNYHKHTRPYPTDAYGEIDFVNVTFDALPFYLRCQIDTPVENLSELLLNRWSLEQPNLLMSVFGGHYSYSQSDTVKGFDTTATRKLQMELFNAAKTTKAWFFTTGTDNGVSKLVGTAVGDKRTFVNSIPTIGITAWGGVKNKECLIDVKGKFPAHYEPGGPDVKRTAALEPNHTHFILLDKGTEHKLHKNEVSKKRIQLEIEIVEKTSAQLVSILIEGGITSLKQVIQRIEAHHSVVVLAESGRMANVLCYAIEMSQERFKNRRKSFRHLKTEEDVEEVLNLLKTTFPEKAEEVATMDECMKDIETILTNNSYITICYCLKNSESAEKLDKSILKALIKSHQNHDNSKLKQSVAEKKRREELLIYHQIELAIGWDRIDLVVELMKLEKVDLTDSQVNKLMFIAIVNNKVSFVKFFIDVMGADIKRFLKNARFDQLLDKVPKTSLLFKLLSKEVRKSDDQFTYEHFCACIYGISEGVYKCPKKKRIIKSNLAQAESNTTVDEKWRMSLVFSKSIFKNTIKYTNVKDDKNADVCYQTEIEDPENLLALYCCLLQRAEMAVLFWEYSRTPVFLALVCSHLTRWMKKMEQSNQQFIDSDKSCLDNVAQQYDQLSYKIISEAQTVYGLLWTNALITHKYYHWGGISALEVAVYCQSTIFISHPGVQDYITREWWGMLDPDMRYWQLVLLLPFPFLASFKRLKISDLEKKKIAAETDEKERRKKYFVCKPQEGSGEGEKQSQSKLSLLKKCYYFYDAPVTKFFCYIFTYMIFIFCYAYALLYRPRPAENTVASENKIAMMDQQELVVYIWVFCTIPIEIRQIHQSSPSTLKGKFSNYFSSMFNKTDIVSCMMVLMAYSQKYMAMKDGHGKVNIDADIRFRIMFSLGFVGYCLRIAQFLQIHPKLGPKVLIMQSMIIDLFFFIGLLAISVVSYGVFSESIMKPAKADLTLQTVGGMLWRPYINLFGELDIDTLETGLKSGYCKYYKQLKNETLDCNSTSTFKCEEYSLCRYNRVIVYAALALYMIFIAVLMMNLLIAVFSYTYEQINANSDILWKWQRYDLITEFSRRSGLPVPLNTFYMLIMFLRFVFRKHCGKAWYKIHRESQKKRDEHMQIKIALLETECRRNYLFRKSKALAPMPLRIEDALTELHEIKNRVKGLEQLVRDTAGFNTESLSRPAVSATQLATENSTSLSETA